MHLGDGHEADSASRWPTEYDWSLEDEFKSHAELLRRVRLAAKPGTRLVFMAGNHDDNILTLNRIDRKLRSLCDYRRHEAEAEELSYWSQYPYVYDRNHGVFRLGQVSFAHGYEASRSGDESQSILLGVPHGLYIGGHTHRPKDVTQARKGAIELPYWYANAGCLRELKPHYVERSRTHEWGQAVVVGAALDTRSTFAKGNWYAETRVISTYDEWSTSQGKKRYAKVEAVKVVA